MGFSIGVRCELGDLGRGALRFEQSKRGDRESPGRVSTRLGIVIGSGREFVLDLGDLLLPEPGLVRLDLGASGEGGPGEMASANIFITSYEEDVRCFFESRGEIGGSFTPMVSIGS